jgi:N-acetylneuraminic acid mutarotase
MKNFLTAFGCLLVFFSQAQITTSSQWTWIKGDNSINQLGIYGAQGTADAANKPGSRDGSINWTDGSGNFWLFGGLGYPVTGVAGRLNDLWRYNIVTNEWTWMKGDNSRNKPGVYGSQGTADAANKPGGRQYSVSWTDASGNFWLFGGQGNAASGAGRLNDLWKYDIVTNEWTWMKGNNSIDQLAVYGIQGVADAANKPGSREYSVSWADASGNLWLFGGFGWDELGSSGVLSDLWKYNIATNEWTWMKGDNIPYQPGVYGTQGIADAANNPGSRQRHKSWTDASGNLWLFGGNGTDGSGFSGYLNDLWKYNTVTNEWTWMKGDNSTNQYGVYGTQGIADAANNPGGRDRSVVWTDGSGNLWLFGGVGYDLSGFSGSFNALWKYNTVTNQWTWAKGDNSRNQFGVYGIQGTADVANKPGSRSYSSGWMDGSGNLWLFGGSGYDASGLSGRLNDVWKLSVDLITLPLHLLEFNGRLQNNYALLIWKTENEQNTSYFEIERSTDGRNYIAVGNIAAFSQPGIHQYNYTDNDIVSLGVPVVYYRLKQKDKDGRFTWSRIVALSIDNSKNLILIYPNPVINEANLTITVNKKEKVQVRIIDNTGRIIKQQQMNLTEGSNALSLDVSGLTKGIYFLELKGETVNERKQFVKL